MICTLLLCTYYKVLPTFHMIFNLASWGWQSILKVKQLFILTFFFFLIFQMFRLYFVLYNDINKLSLSSFSLNIFQYLFSDSHANPYYKIDY